MADLNQGTRQRNLRQLSGSANVPNQLRNVGGGVPAPSTDLLQALGGHIGGWWIENQRLTADGGNAKLNANVPSISLGAATDYLTGAGIWFGKNSSVYKAHIGDPAANHLKWDGTTLTVVGTISATAGAIGGWTIGATSISADGGNVTIDSATPHLGIGANSYLGGAGVFLGKSSGAYKFSIGSLAGSYLSYDGGTGALTLNGTVTTNSLNPALQSFTTSIVFSSTDNDTVNWSAGTIRLASGMTYSINAGNTGNMAALTYIYLDTAVSTTALQTTTTYSNAVGDNRLLLAAAQNHAVGASVIPHTGQQPIINSTDQITALSITAGQLATGAVTAGKISVTTLAAIQANIGAANISDVLTIGAGGGIYQGTGTFGAPTTGLKVWNDGGVGRLATYASGTPQVYFDTTGKLNAGAGNVSLDATGITIVGASSTSLSTYNKVRFLLYGTSTEAAYVGQSKGVLTQNLAIYSFVSGYNNEVAITAHSDTGNKSADVYMLADNSANGTSAQVTVQSDGRILLSGNAQTSGTLTISDGQNLQWSDVNLYRSAANVLKTDDSFIVGGGLTMTWSGTTVQTLAPNAWNTITHNLATSSNLIFAINGDYGANTFSVDGVQYVNSNSFRFYAAGGAVGPARINWFILR